MNALESVQRELAEMHRVGIMEAATLRNATSYVQNNEDEVRGWLDSAMSVTDVCDLLLSLVGRH